MRIANSDISDTGIETDTLIKYLSDVIVGSKKLPEVGNTGDLWRVVGEQNALENERENKSKKRMTME